MLPKEAGAKNPLQELLLHFTLPPPFSSPCSLDISVSRILSLSQEQRRCLALPEISPCSVLTVTQVPPWCLAGGRRAELYLTFGLSLSLPPTPERPHLGPLQQHIMLAPEIKV